MSKIALLFFSAAPVYGLVGMIWGIQMGSSGDHSMMPAHAHLNLLGFVLNGIFGAFYAFAGDRASGRLAYANFAASNVGVLLMIPTLATILAGSGPPSGTQIAVMGVGEVLAVLGVLLFLTNVLRMWRKPA
jgi:hypothetical protein